MTPTSIALIMAIVSPFIWGFMNVLDKYVVSHRVKNTLSFTLVAGFVNLFIGLILAIFLNWQGIEATNLIYPAIAGIILGSQFFLYYFMLGKEDVSNVIGFIYFYPVIVAILSFLFLNEVLSSVSYIGMAFILFGILMLALRAKKMKFKIGAWMIVLLILNVAILEFFIKISTNNLPELNGVSITHIFIGLTTMFGFLHNKTRKGFSKELKNFKFSMLVESLTFLGTLTLYFAMSGLKATFVSSIAATQPVTVLFFEFLFHKRFGKISRDTKTMPKLIAILLIVIGIVLLYLPEIIKLV